MPTPALRLPLVALMLFAMLSAFASGGFAQERTGSASGLPLPRFVTVSAAPVNVRVGPGTNYNIAWTYVKPRMPVEIVEEFDTWRQIRDHDGETGWVHQSLLTGERTGLIEPRETQTPLRASAAPDSAVQAWLTLGLHVELRRCDGTYCEASLTHAVDGRSNSYRGWVAQADVWGAYPGESFD